MAVHDGRLLAAVDDRGNASSKLMVAVDAARHVEVADGGTVQANERSTVVVDEYEPTGQVAATVVGQRMAVAVEGAAEGLCFASHTDTLEVEVGGQTEELSSMALLVCQVVG